MTESGSTAHQKTPEKLLAQKVLITCRVIFWERLWPALVPPLAVTALFLAVSWFGLWMEAPRFVRIAGTLLFAGLFLMTLRGFIGLRGVADADARLRLDRDSGMPHRPVEAMTDRLSMEDDPTTKALWALHQKRAEDALSRLKIAVPEPAMRRKDPGALRFAPFVLAVAALFVSGPDLTNRVAAAFQWFEPPVPPPPPRLDVWVDPPAYTGRPPQFLARSSQTPEQQASAQHESVQAPTGSVLVLRATPPEGVSIDVAGALAPAETPATAGTASLEKRFTVTGVGEATIRRGSAILGKFTLTAIPDLAPTVTLKEVAPSENREGLRILYGVKDDYGVKEGDARFSAIPKAGEAPRRTLVGPPSTALTLPYGAQGEADGETSISLSEHPWAGARVRLQLHVKDDAGNTGQSETREITLPQKTFTHPLAKALVEQRRNIYLDPDRKDRVQIALDALLTEPEMFFAKESGAYIGLRLAAKRLKIARNDAQLIEVADWLWAMAIELDDGGLSDAEKALREAQERLKEALDRNADASEIKKLTEDLRKAMDRYMRELAERALRDNRNAENQKLDPNAKVMRPEDFRKMLQEIEKLAREGKHAEAQQLLDQLKQMMENLQAQRGQRQMGERERGMNESMNELDKLSREQQQLRDRTYKEGQERRRQSQRDAWNNRQPGQQGQRGQRQPGQQQPGQGQQGQRGQPGGDGQGDDGEQDMAEGQDGQGQGQGQDGRSQGRGQGQGLQQRQEQLRQQLERLQRRMRDLGMNGEKGLGDAEGAMREAERQLGRGQEGPAVDSQGKALEALRRGMQGMAQQMQQQGEGDGTEQAEGGYGNDDPNRTGQPRANSGNSDTDPLGRETRNRLLGESARMRLQGHEGGTVGERARRVLEELRRRLGESERPRLELDYFERLLPKN